MTVIETKQRIVLAKNDEKDQINLAMSELYSEGCRRLRAVRLPRNGDYDRYRIMGWSV